MFNFSVRILLILSILSYQTTPVVWAADDAPASSQDQSAFNELISSLRPMASLGYFTNREDYQRTLEGIRKYRDQTNDGTPLDENNNDELLATLNALEANLGPWLDQLIARAEALRERSDSDPFPSVSFDQIRQECGELDDVAIARLKSELEFIKRNGGATRSGTGEAIEISQAEVDDCEAQLDLFLLDVRNHATKLKEKLDVLRTEIAEKKTECANLTDEAKVECENELRILNTEYDDLVEEYTDTQEVEASGKDWKIALGVLAIIGGVVAAFYGDFVTSTELLGFGTALLQSANKKTIKDVPGTRKVGQKRNIDAAVEATPEQDKTLEQQMAGQGYERVVFEGGPEGKSVSIYRNNTEILVLFTADANGSPTQIAKLNAENTRVAPNKLGVESILDLQLNTVVDPLFVDNNAVNINFSAKRLSDGSNVSGAVLEKDVGSGKFILTLEE